MNLAGFSEDTINELTQAHGTPLYAYNQQVIANQIEKLLSWQAPFGTTARYAMKANPHPEVLRTMHASGIHIDASSWYEVLAAQEAGIPAENISLNSQQLPDDMQALVNSGVHFVATSLHQLEAYGKAAAGSSVGIRLNPGKGSGMNNRLNTAGVNAGFGIWHEYITDIQALAKTYSLTIETIHTHIGSGTDPEEWKNAAATTLEFVKAFPTATTMSLGGGFKVGYMPGEQDVDITAVASHVNALLEQFSEETGRTIHLEIEPGKFLVAASGILIAKVVDIVDTGANGHTFLRLNTGMNDILRPTMYGAQHPLSIIAAEPRTNESTKEYVVIGHNCESGDIITPAKGDPEGLAPRWLATARIGDMVVIGMAGAYCASMRAKGYNAYPDAKEVFVG